jgi:hypothetical protein
LVRITPEFDGAGCGSGVRAGGRRFTTPADGPITTPGAARCGKVWMTPLAVAGARRGAAIDRRGRPPAAEDRDWLGVAALNVLERPDWSEGSDTTC